MQPAQGRRDGKGQGDPAVIMEQCRIAKGPPEGRYPAEEESNSETSEGEDDEEDREGGEGERA